MVSSLRYGGALGSANDFSRTQRLRVSSLAAFFFGHAKMGSPSNPGRNGHAVPPPLHSAWLLRKASSVPHDRSMAADIELLTFTRIMASTMLTFSLQTPASTAPAGVCREEQGPESSGGSPSRAFGQRSILGRHPQAPDCRHRASSCHASSSASFLYALAWSSAPGSAHNICERAPEPLQVARRSRRIQPACKVPGPQRRTQYL